MDKIQLKSKLQNYTIKGICQKNKKENKNNCLLIKQVIALLLLLTLNITIFILFYSKKKIKNNLLKRYKRKLEEFEIPNYSDKDIDIDTIYNIAPETNISQNSSYYSDSIAETIITKNIFNNCTALEFFTANCTPNNTNKEEDTEYIYHILEQIEEGKLNELFNKTIEEDINIIQKDNNITYQISTVSSQYSANLSTVSLEKCESILKDIYSIDKDEKLILLKLEHKVEKIQIPIIEYQLFAKDGLKLNLSYCDQIPELVSIPVIINGSEEFIHNPNSYFYKDRCYTYTSEDGTDMTLFIRKKNFNEKLLSLCEKNCIYKGYNNTNKIVNCECKTKNEFPKYTTEKLVIKDLLYQFIDFGKISNIFVFTCAKVLFTSKGFKTNYGSYFNIVIIVGSGIFAIIFYLKGYFLFKDKINHRIDVKFPGGDNGIPKSNDNIQNTENNLDLTIKGLQIPNNMDNHVNNSETENYYNDYELYNLEYEEAKEHDKRSFLKVFISQIKANFLPIFTFFMKDDYNSTEIVICLFLFGLSLDFAIRALFFTDSTMHKIYKDKGKYNFLYQIPKIIYPILIAFILKLILKCIVNYENRITKLLKEEKAKNMENFNVKEEINKLLLSLKRTFTIFFILMMIFILLFWYYSSSFCAVFQNTQIPLIKDTYIGYATSLSITLIITLVICFLRVIFLRFECCECLYKVIGIL